MDQSEVTVGAEGDGGRLATYGPAVRQRTAMAWSRQRQRGDGNGVAKARRVERESRRC